ncbi:zinc-binding dehydrogenase [Streptomyces sp900116325]|uniref:zinc-binding dehydrogenase n=1 Tax=Streptomyces sp. 900116325 TaxID=3154295 RepID=UPI0033A1EEB7
MRTVTSSRRSRMASSQKGIGGGSRSDLEDMNRGVSSHKLRPVIDRVFPFEEALDAAAYLDSGAHFGKVVIKH